jgi:hypothetical protein
LSAESQIYFDNLYGNDSTGGGIGIGGTVQLGMYFYSWSNLFQIPRLAQYSFMIDVDGNQIAEFDLSTPDTISEQSGNVIVRDDTLLVGMAYQRVLTDTGIQGDAVLICHSSEGLIHWKRTFGEQGRLDIPQRVALTDDYGYVLVGQVTIVTGSDDGQVWLVKTDEIGIVEWEQTYGGSNYDNGSDVVQTPDGGYLLLGWTRSYGAGQRDFYLIKTDSEGNEEWYETYGTTAEEIGKNILGLSDGNYLLTGSGSQIGGSLGRIYKVAPNGALIWSKTYVYENNTDHNLHKTVEMWNGDLVSVGVTDLNSNAGYLVRTDSLGEVIWQREYDKNESTDLFYSLLATDDGGFLLSGQAVNEETNSQDAWLLKVDSLGCTFPNCIVGVDEEERTVIVDVWPNPTSEVLNIEKTNDGETLTFSVFDMNGNEVLNQVQYDAHGSIDVSKWAAGIYIMNGFSDKNTFFSLKFMKQ